MIGNMQSPFNKARVDKFVMVISLPKALKIINSKTERSRDAINLDTLQFSIYGTITPEIVVPAVETRYTGSNIYVSSHSRPPYPPVAVKFTIDNQFNNFWVISQWLSLMRDESEGKIGIVNARQLAAGDTTLAEYSTTFNVFVKDEFNKDVIRFDYHNAFPTKLGGIDWNYQESGEIQGSFEFVFSNITFTLV